MNIWTVTLLCVEESKDEFFGDLWTVGDLRTIRVKGADADNVRAKVQDRINKSDGFQSRFASKFIIDSVKKGPK